MTHEEQVKQWAERLRHAESSRQPIAPLRDEMPGDDGTLAYAVQQLNVAHGLAHTFGQFLQGRHRHVLTSM